MRISRRGIIAAGTTLVTGAHAQDKVRAYLVFFDWERTDLTARARQVIAEAAQATTKVVVSRIQIIGHGSIDEDAAQVQELSDDRAAYVAAAIIRFGVPKQVITMRGEGNRFPLDPSRKDQNRRAEIVLIR